MKAILFACLVLAILGNELHFFHYKDGEIKVNNDAPTKISGPIFLEFLNTRNFTAVAGLYVKGKTEVSFDFRMKIAKFVNATNFEIEGECIEGNWGLKPITTAGKGKITGTWNSINYESTCANSDLKMTWSIKAHADAVKCPFYLPAEGAVKAAMLVGQSADDYHPVHVLNFGVIGFTYISGITGCSWYVQNSKAAKDPKPGFLIISNEGDYCAIIDKEGDKFIHSNPAKKLVTLTPMSMIKTFFKNGYTFRDYTC